MNTINEIIEILQAYQRNEEIEWESSRGIWEITTTVSNPNHMNIG